MPLNFYYLETMTGERLGEITQKVHDNFMSMVGRPNDAKARDEVSTFLKDYFQKIADESPGFDVDIAQVGIADELNEFGMFVGNDYTDTLFKKIYTVELTHG